MFLDLFIYVFSCNSKKAAKILSLQGLFGKILGTEEEIQHVLKWDWCHLDVTSVGMPWAKGIPYTKAWRREQTWSI